MAMPDAATTSGLQTADAAVSARPCRLCSVLLIADGTNACTVILYDNASAASGTVLAKLSVKATDTQQTFTSDPGIAANNGIYADVSGTGAAYVVHYAPL